MVKWIKWELGEPVQVIISTLDPIVRLVWPVKDTEDVAVADSGKIQFLCQLKLWFN